MNNISRLALLLLCTAGTAQAAEPMKELGMPLGKKMQAPIALCPSEGLARQASAPCWVKAPATRKGGVQSGFLAVPAGAQGGEWTAAGTFGATVDRHGVLLSVTVHSARADEFAKIRGSLTARLGSKLRAFQTDEQRRTAQWEWKDAVINLDCSAEAGCATRFAFDDREEKRLRFATAMWQR